MHASNFDQSRASRESASVSVMSIRQYFKPRDRLPNPRGPFVQLCILECYSLANKEMENEITENEDGQVQEVAGGVTILYPYIFVL